MTRFKELKNTSGDLEIVNGSLATVEGEDQLFQAVRQRLQTLRGEWRYNLNLGIPYIEEITTKIEDLDLVKSIFREALIETDGVAEVIDLQLTRERGSRNLIVDATIRGDTGAIIRTNPVSISVGGA